MLPHGPPGHIYAAFDDHRLEVNAGLVLPVTLAHHLGLGELANRHVDIADALGQADAGGKLLKLVGWCAYNGLTTVGEGVGERLAARSGLVRRSCRRLGAADHRGPCVPVIPHHPRKPRRRHQPALWRARQRFTIIVSRGVASARHPL